MGHTQNTEQAIKRQTQWITTQFHTPPEHETPEIDHIAEKEWDRITESIKLREQQE